MTFSEVNKYGKATVLPGNLFPKSKGKFVPGLPNLGCQVSLFPRTS